jgi:hypothetical protein
LNTPTAATTINGEQVRELAINNRNFTQLVALAPGVRVTFPTRFLPARQILKDNQTLFNYQSTARVPAKIPLQWTALTSLTEARI